MEEIKTYLDKMFTGLPATEKVRKAKNELLTMMTDKYKELIAEGKSENEALGTVIMEFGNLNELSEALGLTEEIRSAEANRITLTQSDAEAYWSSNEKFAIFVGIGSGLMITSPSLIITSAALNAIPAAEALGKILLVIGIIVMLILIAAGVGSIVYGASLTPRTRWLREQHFSLDADAAAFVKEKRAAEYRRSTLITIAAIACFIMAALPPSITGILNGLSRSRSLYPLIVFSIVGTLLLAAIGVFLIQFGGLQKQYFDILEGKTKPSHYGERSYKASEKVNAIVWSLVAPVYILISFLTGAWRFTWLIFPFATAFSAILAIVTRNPEKKD